jgi:hypothetical protein
MEIIGESAKVPTNKDNAFERISLLYYLKGQRVPELREFNEQGLGRPLRTGDYAALGKTLDGFLAKLRETGVNYEVGPSKRPVGDRRYALTWDEIRRHAAEGHEFASHTITHPYMPVMDEANNVYELEKSTDDIREQLGPKHTFSVEAPYGIDDPRVKVPVTTRFPLTRNWVTDEFMDGFLRDDNRDPASGRKEYIQWQRGPLARTPLATMKEWVDRSINHGFWLVLVFHGVEGIGWEGLTVDNMRAYYDYIKDHQSQVWIATFQDGGKYAREKVNAQVTSTHSGDTITVSVKHSLDPKVYDVPLTARTQIPSDWRVVRFSQGKDARWIPISREGGNTYALYRITPDGTPATLEKGQN